MLEDDGNLPVLAHQDILQLDQVSGATFREGKRSHLRISVHRNVQAWGAEEHVQFLDTRNGLLLLSRDDAGLRY